MNPNRKYTYYILFTSLILVILDQLTKLAVYGKSIFGISFEGIRSGEYIRVIGDFLQFTYVENPGMAFGISFGAGKILLSLFSVVASVGLIWYLFKIENYSKFLRFAFAIILAGATGNLIDRVFYGLWFQGRDLFYGNVVDFIMVDIPDISFGTINYSHWPVFNIADACVTVGVVLLLLNYKKIPQFEDLKKTKVNNENTN